MKIHRTTVFTVLSCLSFASLMAGSPEVILQGQQLFEREWKVRDSRIGGDGLGPLFNGVSCVQCHRQGGVGGGGEAEFNAITVGIEKLQMEGGGIDDDTIKQFVSAFHP